ncbi:MAG: NUDIX hydrolase, partial [Clostridia bacterium]|nr:NUDIX hydrolase [Clostridia bacterium]
PIDNGGNVILVRQYRYPMEKVTLEIPAGKLDTPDEDRLEAAKRELREETGAVAENIICLGDFYGSPAFVDEKITMYAASGLSFGEAELDEGEFLTTVKMPLSDAVELVMDGKIEDVKTQAAILRAYLMREQGRL